MANGKKTSPWVWIGVGCLGMVVIMVAVVAGMGYLGYRSLKRMGDEIKDPESREKRVREVLGADVLPPGYHPVVALSLPFIMDMAILSDREPDFEGRGGGFDRQGFIYIKMLGIAEQQRDLKEFFEGKRDESDVLRKQSIRIRSGDVIRRGEMPGDDRRVLYVARRGGIETQNAEVEGVTTMLLIECREDKKTRLGIWFGPDPDPETPAGSANFEGSPADENQIRSFVEHFDFCRKK